MPVSAPQQTTSETIDIEVQSTMSKDNAALRVRVRSVDEAERILTQIMPMLQNGSFRAIAEGGEVRVIPSHKSRAFGERLSRMRRRFGWTQQQLSERTDIGQSKLSEIESNKRVPRPLTVRKIARAFQHHRPSLRGMTATARSA